MFESEYKDGSGDDRQARETDCLDDLRVRCRKSAVLFTVLTVALIACNMLDESWKRSRLQWGTYLSKMPETHFITLFRMDYRTFKHVLDMTEHGMQRHYLQSERTGGFVSQLGGWREAATSILQITMASTSPRSAGSCTNASI